MNRNASKEQEKIKEEQSLDNRCPSCGASISFNPTLGKWKCEYCGNVFSLEELQKNNHQTKEKVKDNIYTNYVSYKF